MINLDPHVFSEEVIQLVEKQGFTVMEAILDRCELYNIDPSATELILTDPVKTRLKREAEDLHFFKKEKHPSLFE